MCTSIILLTDNQSSEASILLVKISNPRLSQEEIVLAMVKMLHVAPEPIKNMAELLGVDADDNKTFNIRLKENGDVVLP